MFLHCMFVLYLGTAQGYGKMGETVEIKEVASADLKLGVVWLRRHDKPVREAKVTNKRQ